jgi:hypothetical protein
MESNKVFFKDFNLIVIDYNVVDCSNGNERAMINFTPKTLNGMQLVLLPYGHYGVPFPSPPPKKNSQRRK